MYNRYQGNTGRFVQVPDPPPARRSAPISPMVRRSPPPRTVNSAPQAVKGPPPAMGGGLGGLLQGLGGGIGNMLGVGSRPGQGSSGLSSVLEKVLPDGLESEDLLLLLVLYLMYKESGDKELLIILGAMFLL